MRGLDDLMGRVVHFGAAIERAVFAPAEIDAQALEAATGIAAARWSNFVAGRGLVDIDMAIALALLCDTETDFFLHLQDRFMLDGGQPN